MPELFKVPQMKVGSSLRILVGGDKIVCGAIIILELSRCNETIRKIHVNFWGK